ncbi:hypothetical protein NDU88_008068 [Pleurodeles waltl]|uniref:Secreted protein n=1 Tax=Pleurodeles waltl TaxID=8319 RepID=A0AAV7SUP6_PLEWA|nr:hypothetical protein NDU88_008068 [Pleurodeles waltl]
MSNQSATPSAGLGGVPPVLLLVLPLLFTSSTRLLSAACTVAVSGHPEVKRHHSQKAKWNAPPSISYNL